MLHNIKNCPKILPFPSLHLTFFLPLLFISPSLPLSLYKKLLLHFESKSTEIFDFILLYKVKLSKI